MEINHTRFKNNCKLFWHCSHYYKCKLEMENIKSPFVDSVEAKPGEITKET